MATYTSNINLKKPAQSDKIRIADFNTNADNIDDAFGAGFGQSSAPSVNAEINSLADGLAIIANGDVHAAITSGQFVYVRNHSTLANGLYVANQNISANATLTSSNLDADSSGGLNALSANIASLDLTKASVTNANEDLDNGVYYCTSATTNMPAASAGSGLLVNLKAGGSSLRRIQFVLLNANLWFRFGYISGSSLAWQPWYKVTATEVT